MRLDEVLSKAGAHKRRTRYGRGTGSGKGKTAGRGTKGLGARAGSGHRLGYEGGSNPQIARLPQRGFTNAEFRKDYEVVNVSDLNRFEDGARVDGAVLAQARLVSDKNVAVKILGTGDLSKKLTVVAAKFSASAAEKIANAGGSIERLT